MINTVQNCSDLRTVNQHWEKKKTKPAGLFLVKSGGGGGEKMLPGLLSIITQAGGFCRVFLRHC